VLEESGGREHGLLGNIDHARNNDAA
jgi:hypothetical protein